jgi:hypothetical protein
MEYTVNFDYWLEHASDELILFFKEDFNKHSGGNYTEEQYFNACTPYWVDKYNENQDFGMDALQT